MLRVSAIEARGVLEYDLSELPANPVVESAVLTLMVGGVYRPYGVESVPIEVFGYSGNAVVESADAGERPRKWGNSMPRPRCPTPCRLIRRNCRPGWMQAQTANPDLRQRAGIALREFAPA